MKTLLFAFILFATSQAYSQTKQIDSFLGIRFGSTPQQVNTAILARGGRKNVAASKPGEVIYTNVKLGGRSTELSSVAFVDGKAYRASFVLKPDPEPQILDEYKSISSTISEVYGEGTETKEFNYPFEDGDGHELTAIKSGNADISTMWSDDKGLIVESVSNEMFIFLTYGDLELTRLAKKRENAKQRADY